MLFHCRCLQTLPALCLQGQAVDQAMSLVRGDLQRGVHLQGSRSLQQVLQLLMGLTPNARMPVSVACGKGSAAQLRALRRLQCVSPQRPAGKRKARRCSRGSRRPLPLGGEPHLCNQSGKTLRRAFCRKVHRQTGTGPQCRLRSNHARPALQQASSPVTSNLLCCAVGLLGEHDFLVQMHGRARTERQFALQRPR